MILGYWILPGALEKKLAMRVKVMATMSGYAEAPSSHPRLGLNIEMDSDIFDATGRRASNASTCMHVFDQLVAAAWLGG